MFFNNNFYLKKKKKSHDRDNKTGQSQKLSWAKVLEQPQKLSYVEVLGQSENVKVNRENGEYQS